MQTQTASKTDTVVLIAVLIALIILCALWQFSLPVLFGIDDYYHIKTSSLILEKGMGFNRNFSWARFSTFSNSYADKDLVFHLLIAPFTKTGNIIFGAKCAVIFINVLFLCAFAFLLTRYLPRNLTVVFLILPFFSSYFLLHFLKLRPATVVTIINMLGVYFLIRKQWLKAACVALIYPLTHISFPLLILFAVVCEGIRFLYEKKFYTRTVTAVIAATALGCLLHPHLPHNLFVFFLNGIVVPYFTFTNSIELTFGGEFLPLTTKYAFFANITSLLTLLFLFWDLLRTRTKTSFATAVFSAVCGIYLFLAAMSARFWYQASIFAFLFAASYLCDRRKLPSAYEEKREGAVKYILVLIVTFVCAASFFLSLGTLHADTARINEHYERTARWMNKHLPANETIYHAMWSDSPYFYCLNPKNNYLVLLDPIYMAYYDPAKYVLYTRLKHGQIKDPHVAIPNAFAARYGYVRKETLLFRQLKNISAVTFLYEDALGAVFTITK